MARPAASGYPFQCRIASEIALVTGRHANLAVVTLAVVTVAVVTVAVVTLAVASPSPASLAVVSREPCYYVVSAFSRERFAWSPRQHKRACKLAHLSPLSFSSLPHLSPLSPEMTSR